MDFKTFWKSNTAFVLKMLALAVIVGIVLYLSVFVWLRSYTEHGIEVGVPDICGMYTTEAEIMVQESELLIQVVDSTYSNKVPLGTIVEQNPAAGAKAKHGRHIYVIVNAKQARMVPLPELKDMSQRQAEATLRSLNLQVKDVFYEPSEFRGLVLDVRKEGNSLSAGERLQEGTAVDLVIGQGRGTEQVPVPLLVGKTLEDARKILLASRLVLGAIDYAEPYEALADSVYYIYQQNPQRGDMILEGSRIDISLSLDSTYTPVITSEEEEDDFFN